MDLTVGQQSDALRPLHRSCSLASSCQQLLTVGSVSSGSLWSVLQRVSSPGCGGDWPSSFLSYSLATWVKRLSFNVCVFWNSSSSFCLHFQFWQLYNGITLFRMSQLPECKEWQVCVGHRIKTLVELMSRHSGWTVIRFNQKSKTLCFLMVCVCVCVPRCWCAAVLTWFSSWETSSRLLLLFTRNTGTIRESQKSYRGQ